MFENIRNEDGKWFLNTGCNVHYMGSFYSVWTIYKSFVLVYIKNDVFFGRRQSVVSYRSDSHHKTYDFTCTWGLPTKKEISLLKLSRQPLYDVPEEYEFSCMGSYLVDLFSSVSNAVTFGDFCDAMDLEVYYKIRDHNDV